MTVAELIERLSKQNQDYVIYRDYGNGLEEASWGDFMELFWIWDKLEVKEMRKMTMCLVFDMSCPYFDDLTCMCTLANPAEDCDDYAVYANEEVENED